MSNEDFDSVEYWRARHEKFKSDPTGVGNVVYERDENQRIYDIAAENLTLLLKNMNVAEPKRALDLGCGIGMMTSSFLNAGCTYTGVDVSETAIEIAKEKFPDSEFFVSSISDIPLSGPFEVAIERTVLIHLVEEDLWRGALQEVARLLAKNGVFIIQDYIPTDEQDTPKHVAHVKQRNYETYERTLSEFGLKFDKDLREKIESVMPLSANTRFVTHK